MMVGSRKEAALLNSVNTGDEVRFKWGDETKKGIITEVYGKGVHPLPEEPSVEIYSGTGVYSISIWNIYDEDIEESCDRHGIKLLYSESEDYICPFC